MNRNCLQTGSNQADTQIYSSPAPEADRIRSLETKFPLISLCVLLVIFFAVALSANGDLQTALVPVKEPEKLRLSATIQSPEGIKFQIMGRSDREFYIKEPTGNQLAINFSIFGKPKKLRQITSFSNLEQASIRVNTDRIKPRTLSPPDEPASSKPRLSNEYQPEKSESTGKPGMRWLNTIRRESVSQIDAPLINGTSDFIAIYSGLELRIDELIEIKSPIYKNDHGSCCLSCSSITACGYSVRACGSSCGPAN